MLKRKKCLEIRLRYQESLCQLGHLSRTKQISLQQAGQHKVSLPDSEIQTTEKTEPVKAVTWAVPEKACKIQTPLKAAVIKRPSGQVVCWVYTEGNWKWFSNWFPWWQHVSHMWNMVSAIKHPEVVTGYLEAEVELERLVKVGSPEWAKGMGIHCSPFGVIPKKDKKWRMILNLSSPEGHRMNDGVWKDLSSILAKMKPIGTFHSIQRIGIFWECSGRGRCSLTLCSHLA